MPERRIARVRLHLDADTSRKALVNALLDRGHDVTRTPCEWMTLDASDEVQLQQASARGRAIFTFNIRDFVTLHRRMPDHHGILLAAQQSWTLSELVHSLDQFLKATDGARFSRRMAWLERA